MSGAGADFSAFRRNKTGYRRSPPSQFASDSSIDFRFRNAEKWFQERRALRSAPPPGLKKPVPLPLALEEIRIPSYDDFDYVGTDVMPDSCVRLLPDNWESVKWQQGMANDVRAAWFRLPPEIQEGECAETSLDLPLLIYESGRTALEALPFMGLVQHDYYMLLFQCYYNMYLSGV
jgi:hypothetical protein